MKIIAFAALIGTISAIQISAPGQDLYQAPPKPLDANGNQVKKSGKPEHAVGNGAIEQDQKEPPLTKVYQEVDMSSKCSNGVCHVKECFDGKCKTYEKKQPPKFEFQKPDTHWKGKDSKKEADKTETKEVKKESEKEIKKESEKEVKKESDKEVKKEANHEVKQEAEQTETTKSVEAKVDAEGQNKEQEPTQKKEQEPHLTVPEKNTPSTVGGTGSKAKIADLNMHQNDNLKQINSIIKEVKNRPPTEANKILLDGIVDDTMIDMDIYSGKKTKEAADILKDKTVVMVKSSEIEQEMVQTNSVLNNIEKLLAKTAKK